MLGDRGKNFFEKNVLYPLTEHFFYSIIVRVQATMDD
jgi:hypothetical protein